jgi:enhancing lycopene biosynthesis protein 2
MHKPIGALCIAPVVVANVLKNGVKVTIGNDSSTIKDIEAMGATHELAGATDVVVDTEKNVHTTPCYMLASKISEVYDGIEKLVKSVLNSL